MTDWVYFSNPQSLDQLAAQPRFGEVRALLSLASGLVENEHSKGADDIFSSRGRLDRKRSGRFVFQGPSDQPALLQCSLDKAGEQGMRVKRL